MKIAEKRNPALVELVLVILFFALSSVVLVQVFVKAHQVSQESQAQTLGLILSEDLLEQWKENGWREEKTGGNVQTFLSGCTESMELSAPEDAAYEIRTELWNEATEAGVLYHIRVLITGVGDGKLKTELETARYVPEA